MDGGASVQNNCHNDAFSFADSIARVRKSAHENPHHEIMLTFTIRPRYKQRFILTNSNISLTIDGRGQIQ